MQIQINAGDVELSEAIEQHVLTTIEHALRHHESRITRVEVHLRDDNRHKAGESDKRCTIEVRLAGFQPLAVEQDGSDLYDVIKQAAGKAHRAVERKLDRNADH